MSGAFESTLLSPPRSTNKLFMETGFGVNAGFERYRNSEYAVSDGATSNRAAGIYGPFDATNNPREWVAGAATLTDVFVMTVPTSSSTAEIVGRSSSTSALASATAWSMSVAWSTNDLVIRCNGATPATDFRTVTFSGLRTAYSGQTVFAKAFFANGATDPTLQINGVTLTGTIADGAGTDPTWLSASMVPTYRLIGYNWAAGPAPVVTPILGTTSAADDTFYMSTGKWPAWVVAGGNTSNLLTGDNSTFASDTGYWTKLGAATISAGVLNLGTTASDAIIVGSFLTKGVRYRATAIVNSGTGLFLGWDSSIDYNMAVTGVGTFSLEFIANGTGVVPGRLGLYSTGSAVVDSFSIIRLGALSLPSIHPINVVDDVSGIGTNCGLILGAVTTATSNKKVWRIADLTKTSGNEQLLGGAVFVGTSQDYIKSWTIVNEGGITTVSLGNVSGGAQYVSGLSVPTGTTVVTLLTNTPLTTNLWCNASTTASLTHVIEGYRTT